MDRGRHRDPGTSPSPATPQTPTTRVSSADAITVSWKAPDDNGAPITYYDIRYWPQDDTTDFVSDRRASAPAARSRGSITGLDAERIYVFKVRALNSAGIGSWSPNAQRAIIPPEAPGAPHITVQSAASAKVTWNEPDGNGRSHHRIQRLEYQRVDTRQPLWKHWPHARRTKTTATITGLEAGKRYEARISAITVAGIQRLVTHHRVDHRAARRPRRTARHRDRARTPSGLVDRATRQRLARRRLRGALPRGGRDRP